MKNEKNYMGFLIPKVWQILKPFAGAFHQAQTSYFWRVTCHFFPNQTRSNILRSLNDSCFWRPPVLKRRAKGPEALQQPHQPSALAGRKIAPDRNSSLEVAYHQLRGRRRTTSTAAYRRTGCWGFQSCSKHQKQLYVLDFRNISCESERLKKKGILKAKSSRRG